MLVAEIARLHEAAERNAGRSLQRIMSVRNWLIGAYTVAFEQDGEDRAEYGARLLEKLADSLRLANCKGLSARNLWRLPASGTSLSGTRCGQGWAYGRP